MKDKNQTLKFNLIAIFCIIILCIAISPVTLQNDTFYTIKIGEYVLENGITMQDPFSWHENLSYVFPHWAYDVYTYLVYTIGGLEGIYIFTVILACILGIVMYYVCVSTTKNQFVSFILILGAMYLLRSYIAARAQLVTFILFILTMFFIEKFLQEKKKRYAIFLIIIPILIANIHVAVWPFYFVLYLPYIGEYIISILSNVDVFFVKQKIKILNKKLKNPNLEDGKRTELIDTITTLQLKLSNLTERKEKIKQKAYKIRITRNDNTKWLIVIMLICVLTGFLTPIGTTPYTYLTDTMKGNTTDSINEHLPLTLVENMEFMSVLLIFIGVLMFTDTKINLSDLFLIGGLIVLAFYSRRQISLVVLLGVVVLARLICSLLNKYDPKISKKAVENITKTSGIIITVSIVLIISLLSLKPKLNEKFINESSYPVAAANFILENLDVENIRLYNEYNYGSYLLFKDIPVFIDSRADLYTPEFNEGVTIFDDFIKVSGSKIYYETIFDKYNITHVITKKNSMNLQISRDDNYKLLYQDDNFLVYERLTAKAE